MDWGPCMRMPVISAPARLGSQAVGEGEGGMASSHQHATLCRLVRLKQLDV